MLVIQILVAVGIIGLVLIQQGKGADAGAAFGGGASGTVFGSKGSGNFLTRLTAILVAVFFANSLMLAWLVAHPDNVSGGSIVPSAVVESVVPKKSDTSPVADIPSGSPAAQAPAKTDGPSDIPK